MGAVEYVATYKNILCQNLLLHQLVEKFWGSLQIFTPTIVDLRYIWGLFEIILQLISSLH